MPRSYVIRRKSRRTYGVRRSSRAKSMYTRNRTRNYTRTTRKRFGRFKKRYMSNKLSRNHSKFRYYIRKKLNFKAKKYN